MRGKRPTLAALAVTGIVLAQVTACGGCVKDDPAGSSDPAASGGRKPIDLRAADKRLSQFSSEAADRDGGSDSGHD